MYMRCHIMALILVLIVLTACSDSATYTTPSVKEVSDRASNSSKLLDQGLGT